MNPSDLLGLISKPIILFAVIAIAIIVIVAVMLRCVLRIQDHFRFVWVYKTEEGRTIQVFTSRRQLKTPQKLAQCLRWFGFRIMNNSEAVSLLKDNECPANVFGYEPASGDRPSGEWLKIVRLPGNLRTIERFKQCPEIMPEVTLFGVTKINFTPPSEPAKVPEVQAVAQ